ncbi:MAG: efflux RND transporter periplasmic adaptor subunit, partial [Gemmataceae bacterium]
PDGFLRNGQTGNVLIHRVLPHAVVVPQRATFEILDKRFVYVIDEHHVAHQREIQVEREMDDVFVVRNGVGPNDKIVLDGVREVRDGDHLKYDEVKPADVLSRLKTHAE